jgi:YHS domain-containing protein
VIRILLIGILILLIARAFWRLVDGIIETAGGKPKPPRGTPSGVTLVRDPVCGTHLPPSRALTLSTPSGPQYFCSEACRERFRKSA